MEVLPDHTSAPPLGPPKSGRDLLPIPDPLKRNPSLMKGVLRLMPTYQHNISAGFSFTAFEIICPTHLFTDSTWPALICVIVSGHYSRTRRRHNKEFILQVLRGNLSNILSYKILGRGWGDLSILTEGEEMQCHTQIEFCYEIACTCFSLFQKCISKHNVVSIRQNKQEIYNI